MLFESGKSGNPGGRPKGSYGGRIMALASLDRLLARKKNQKALISALEKDLQGNPVRFFKTVIMPLLPRESKLSFDHEGVIQWRSLLGGDAEQGCQVSGVRRQEEDGAQREEGEDGARTTAPRLRSPGGAVLTVGNQGSRTDRTVLDVSVDEGKG